MHPLALALQYPHGWLSVSGDTQAKSPLQEVCACLRGAEWRSALAEADSTGPGVLTGTLVNTRPAEHNQPARPAVSAPRRRRLVCALAAAGARPIDGRVLAAEARFDPVLWALLKTAQQDGPAALAEHERFEGLLATMFIGGGNLVATRRWLNDQGMDWESLVMGAPAIDVLLALAYDPTRTNGGGWAQNKRSASTGYSDVDAQRQKELLWLEKHALGDAPYRAALWAVAARGLTENRGETALRMALGEGIACRLPAERLDACLLALAHHGSPLVRAMTWTAIARFLRAPWANHRQTVARLSAKPGATPADFKAPAWSPERAWELAWAVLGNGTTGPTAVKEGVDLLDDIEAAHGACPLESFPLASWRAVEMQRWWAARAIAASDDPRVGRWLSEGRAWASAPGGVPFEALLQEEMKSCTINPSTFSREGWRRLELETQLEAPQRLSTRARF